MIFQTSSIPTGQGHTHSHGPAHLPANSQTAATSSPYVFMEVGPDSVTINSISAQVVTSTVDPSTSGGPTNATPQTGKLTRDLLSGFMIRLQKSVKYNVKPASIIHFFTQGMHILLLGSTTASPSTAATTTTASGHSTSSGTQAPPRTINIPLDAEAHVMDLGPNFMQNLMQMMTQFMPQEMTGKLHCNTVL